MNRARAERCIMRRDSLASSRRSRRAGAPAAPDLRRRRQQQERRRTARPPPPPPGTSRARRAGRAPGPEGAPGRPRQEERRLSRTRWWISKKKKRKSIGEKRCFPPVGRPVHLGGPESIGLRADCPADIQVRYEIVNSFFLLLKDLLCSPDPSRGAAQGRWT